MRVRKETPDGDMVFGLQEKSFYDNVPEAPAICVKNRLLLVKGNWFLDTREGTEYYPGILGFSNQLKYDMIIQNRISTTEGVIGIAEYSSSRDNISRKLTVQATINTLYGETNIQEAL